MKSLLNISDIKNDFFEILSYADKLKESTDECLNQKNCLYLKKILLD